MLLEFILRMLNKDWSRLTPNEIALLKDYIRYSASFEHTITELERGLHSTDDPKHIAMKTLITACEFTKRTGAAFFCWIWTSAYGDRTGGMT